FEYLSTIYCTVRLSFSNLFIADSFSQQKKPSSCTHMMQLLDFYFTNVYKLFSTIMLSVSPLIQTPTMLKSLLHPSCGCLVLLLLLLYRHLTLSDRLDKHLRSSLALLPFPVLYVLRLHVRQLSLLST